jgi:non-ribosomal peptide synthetase component F
MLMSGKPGFEDGPHPRQMLVGGEALEESDWKALAKARQTRFVNVYGPTECTVDTTVCFIQDSQSASLGVPLPNIRTYVVDSQLFLSPIGVAGELCISGAGVGRGYENQPALTAERFVPDPFSNVPGSRMYRTGDSARWHVDGKLQYAGRIDRQVKLRGYRIELGEIESGLAEHEDVQHAVAMVREDQPGNQKIVAYVIPRKQQAPAAEEAAGIHDSELGRGT